MLPADSLGQIGLAAVVVPVEMGVLVADPPAQLPGASVMGVLQIGRDRQVPGPSDQILCGKDRVDGGIALWGARDIGGRLGQDDLGLRHADPLAGQGAGDRQADRLRVRVANILRGADHDPAGDEFGVLPRLQHPGQIIDGGVGVRSPHALDKGGDRVVVVVAALVVAGRPPLDTLLGDLQGDMDPAVLRRGLRRQHTQLHGAQGPPGVPSGHIGQKIRGVVIDGGIVHAHSLFAVIDRPQDQVAHILLRERLQLKDRGPGDQGPVNLKIGILRRRPDQGHRAVLDKGQQIVLLGLVEAMDLVDEKDGLLPVHAQAVFGGPDGLFHILFAGRGRVELDELGAGRVGDDPGQRRLARPGRSVKDHRPQLVRLDGPAEQAALSDDMLLAHDLIDRRGAEPGRQRRLGLLLLLPHIVK